MKFFLKLFFVAIPFSGFTAANLHVELLPEAKEYTATWILERCYRRTEPAKRQIDAYAKAGKVASIVVGGIGAVTLLSLLGKNLSDKQKPSTLRTHRTKVLFLSLILMGTGDFGYGVCSHIVKKNESVNEKVNEIVNEIVNKVKETVDKF